MLQVNKVIIKMRQNSSSSIYNRSGKYLSKLHSLLEEVKKDATRRVTDFFSFDDLVNWGEKMMIIGLIIGDLRRDMPFSQIIDSLETY